MRKLLQPLYNIFYKNYIRFIYSFDVSELIINIVSLSKYLHALFHVFIYYIVLLCLYKYYSFTLIYKYKYCNS